MTESRPRLASPRRLPALLLTMAIALPLTSCDGDPVALSFSDFLAHQRDNVSTGLISVPNDLNSHLFTYGWQLDGERRYAELAENLGRVNIFVAGAAPRRLVLRGSINRPAAPAKFRLLVNGRPAGGFTLGSEWQEHRFDIPSGSLRQGPNQLTLRCLECAGTERSGAPRLRLAQLRLLPGPAQRQGVRSAGNDSHPRRFLMPATAYLDLVAELPAAASFRGDLVVSKGRQEAVTVRLTVRDEEGEHTASEWRLDGGERARLQADLGAWSGKLVQLRLAAAADEPLELDWRRAVVTGRGGRRGGGRLPIAMPGSPPRSHRLGRPDIVLVLLDAARADAFEPFGGRHPTPALAALANDGTRFTTAWAPASWTQPSVAALLTGNYPDRIGSDAWGMALSPGMATLTDLLSAAGYRTVLWHQHPFYRSQQELRRGFAEVHWARTNLVDPVPPAELLFAGDRASFTLIHLLPPHAPYEPPAPFRHAYSSWHRGDVDVSARALNSFHGRRDPAELSADDRRYIHDRYLENAAYADSLVGRIRDLLIENGRYDSTLLVVLSDHGESFLEHGRFLHTQQLYNESIHVPLLIKWPVTLAPFRSVVDEPVSLIDLLPTLLDGLGLGMDLELQGRSLLPLAVDGQSLDRPLYAFTRGATESWRPPAQRAALRHGRWKAVYEPLADRLELYDLDSDPGELHDLATAKPLVALLLRQAVLEQMALNRSLLSPQTKAAEPLGRELEKGLRDLGYLGGE